MAKGKSKPARALLEAHGSVPLRETMWAAMLPDMLAGAASDRWGFRWYTYAEGEAYGRYEEGALKLDPKRFPPGTRIIIKEPVSPECGEARAMRYPRPKSGVLFDATCVCGFDWEDWLARQHSCF